MYYFKESGVTNEDVMSIMMNASAWPKPSRVEDADHSLSLITIPVTL